MGLAGDAASASSDNKIKDSSPPPLVSWTGQSIAEQPFGAICLEAK